MRTESRLYRNGLWYVNFYIRLFLFFLLAFSLFYGTYTIVNYPLPPVTMGWKPRGKIRVPGISSSSSSSSSTNGSYPSKSSLTFIAGLLTGVLFTEEVRPSLAPFLGSTVQPRDTNGSPKLSKTIPPSLTLDNPERNGKTSSSVSFLLPDVTVATSLPYTSFTQLLDHQQTITGTSSRNHDRTLPTNIYRRISDHYISEYDPFTRNPRWVYEHLTYDNVFNRVPTDVSIPSTTTTKSPIHDSTTGSNPENSRPIGGDRHEATFKEDTSIPSYLRARLNDYTLSGYDRGHLAPAGNHHTNQVAMNDTFFLSNISPQIGKGFNRHYWSRFEQFIRNLVHGKEFEHVYVITGPLFIPKFKYINKTSSHTVTVPPNSFPVDNHSSDISESSINNPRSSSYGHWVQEYPLIGTPLHWIHVPTHFYKIILTEKSDTSLALATFIIPNQAIPSTNDIKDYLVPLSMVSTLTGLSFFPHKLDNEQSIYADKMDSYNIRTTSTGRNTIDLVHNVEKLLLPSSSGSSFSSSVPIQILASLFNHSTITDKEKAMEENNVSIEDTLFKGYPLPSKKSLASSSVRTVRHLCAITDCTLPPENWYNNSMNGKTFENGNNKHRNSKKLDASNESLTRGSIVGSSTENSSYQSLWNDVGTALREEKLTVPKE